MGYGDAPWTFTGRALYQLQLVPVAEARKYVPDEFKLVSLFGYTLGGFYLARYTDSPVGAFDELVTMAGLVWNWPTSCAWAARVFVSNKEARVHGRRHCGLPSRYATFELAAAASGGTVRRAVRRGGRPVPTPTWWDPDGSASDTPPAMVLRNDERRRTWRAPFGGVAAADGLAEPVAALALPPAPVGWQGPRVDIALPSFSGATPDCPALLQYACKLSARVRLLPPARVLAAAGDDDHPEALGALLRGRPLLAIQFGDMRMVVNEPQRVCLGAQEGRRAGRSAGSQALLS